MANYGRKRRKGPTPKNPNKPEPPSLPDGGSMEEARAEDDGLPLVQDTPAVTHMTAPQLGEGVQPGADSDEGVPGVERTQQERDSDDVPAPTLPEELDESGPEPPQVRAVRVASAKRGTKGFVEPQEVPPWEKTAALGGWVYPGRPTPTGTVMWGEGTLSPEREWPIVRNCSWTEEQYVAHEVGVTKAQIAVGMIKTKRKNLDTGKEWDDTKDRLARCEQYARWRYRGFLAGQIARL